MASAVAGDAGFEDAVGVGVCDQQSIDLGPQFGIPSTGFGQVAGPLFECEFERGEEHIADAVRIGGHD